MKELLFKYSEHMKELLFKYSEHMKETIKTIDLVDSSEYELTFD